MVIMVLTYIQPLEEIDKLLVPHREFLDEYFRLKKFICSGRQEPRVGGVILANVDNVEEAKRIAQKDPFSIHGVAQYEFIEFVPGKYDERFICFMDK
jgi:uncharacterized protein YciI